MTQAALFTPSHFTPSQNQRDLSQWFTPEALAERVTAWAWPSMHRPVSVLEPSCGDGAFVRAALRRGGFVHAYEIDPAMARRCSELVDAEREGLAPWEGATVQDYLAEPALITRHDIGLLNPPYEDGADGRFLSKAMDECDRVAGVFRTAVLDGKERREGIWSRVQSGEWCVSGIAFLGRVVFRIPTDRKPQSASTDFVALKLRRASVGQHFYTELEWWS